VETLGLLKQAAGEGRRQVGGGKCAGRAGEVEAGAPGGGWLWQGVADFGDRGGKRGVVRELADVRLRGRGQRQGQGAAGLVGIGEVDASGGEAQAGPGESAEGEEGRTGGVEPSQVQGFGDEGGDTREQEQGRRGGGWGLGRAEGGRRAGLGGGRSRGRGCGWDRLGEPMAEAGGEQKAGRQGAKA